MINLMNILIKKWSKLKYKLNLQQLKKILLYQHLIKDDMNLIKYGDIKLYKRIIKNMNKNNKKNDKVDNSKIIEKMFLIILKIILKIINIIILRNI